MGTFKAILHEVKEKILSKIKNDGVTVSQTTFGVGGKLIMKQERKLL